MTFLQTTPVGQGEQITFQDKMDMQDDAQVL